MTESANNPNMLKIDEVCSFAEHLKGSEFPIESSDPVSNKINAVDSLIVWVECNKPPWIQNFVSWLQDGIDTTFKDGSIVIQSIIISGFLTGFSFVIANVLRRRHQRQVSAHCAFKAHELEKTMHRFIGEIVRIIEITSSSSGDTLSKRYRAYKNQREKAVLTPELFRNHLDDLDLYVSISSPSYGKRIGFYFYHFLKLLRLLRLFPHESLEQLGAIDAEISPIRISTREAKIAEKLGRVLKKLDNQREEFLEELAIIEKFAFFNKFPYTAFIEVEKSFLRRILKNGFRFLWFAVKYSFLRPFKRMQFSRFQPAYIRYKRNTPSHDKGYHIVYEEKKKDEIEAGNETERRLMFTRKEKNTNSDDAGYVSALPENFDDLIERAVSNITRTYFYQEFWGKHECPPIELIVDRYEEWVSLFNHVRTTDLDNCCLSAVKFPPNPKWLLKVQETEIQTISPATPEHAIVRILNSTPRACNLSL